MKKLISSALMVAGLAAGVTSAQAGVYRDRDNLDAVLNSPGESVSGTFNIRTLDGNFAGDMAGFVPSAETIVTATATFELYSNDSEKEQVDINLGAFDLYTTPGTQINGEVTFGPLNLTVQMLADLQQDGSISYRLTLLDTAFTWGEDVGINYAQLDVTTVPNTVPDGGMTLALLGLSLGGLAVVRRSFRN